MRNTFLYLISFFVMYSCQQSKPSENENSDIKDIVSENKLETTTPTEEKKPTYQFDYDSVTEYSFDYPIEYIERDDQYISKFKTKKIEYEGEQYEEPYLEISDNYGKLFEILYNDTLPKPLMDEFVIYSERMKNPQNISVGNTLDEFFNTYPYATINFSYLGDGFVWLGNGYKGYQFIIEKPEDFFEKIEIYNDGITENISREVFTGNEKIKFIRIFGGSLINNIEGIWSSEDEAVTAAFNRTGNSYHIELSTGKDIYNQFSQDLVPFYDVLDSPPGEKAHIEVRTQSYPDYITLLLDDNEEFEPMQIKLFPKKQYN